MDNRRVLANCMSALKDCEPWEMWNWGDFIETLGIDRSSNWEDTVDRVCWLIGGDPEREAAADWVEANGGLVEVIDKLDAYDAIDDERGYLMELRAEVAARLGIDMACMLPSLAHARILGELYKRTNALERYARMLNRIDSLLAGDEQECFAADTPPYDAGELFGAMLGVLGKRLMPLGMEWPRFEDGGKANVGDYILHDGKSERVQGVYFYKNSVTLSLVGVDHEKLHTIKYGERAKRTEPEVLGADGLPIEAGQTVYTEFSGSPLVVEKIEGAYLLDAGGTMLRADCATHTPPDTQERIDDDATMPPRAYYAKYIGHDVGLKDDAECTEAMVRHLLNRQRGLDAKTMGGE